MNKENEKTEQNPTDPVFGGCQYRLSYEKTERHEEKKSVRPSSVIMVIVIVILFVAAGVIIFFYNRGSFRKIAESELGNDTVMTENFSTYRDGAA